MKRFLSIVFIIALAAGLMQARSLRLVYIAHDVNTPVEQLVSKIEGYYENLEDYADEGDKDRTILYLSSGSNPIIANMESGNRDEENYRRVIRELYERNFHDVDTEVDMEKILELLNEYDFLTPEGRLDMSQLKFEFFVTPTYWSMKQNESFIAPLFYALGLERLCDPSSPDYNRGVTFRIFFPSIEELRRSIGTDGMPFGAKNPGNINNILQSPDFIGTYQ